MRLRALLGTDALGLRLLGGEEELDRSVRGVMTTDLRDPSRYLSGGELVLTGLAWRHRAEDSEPFVRILTSAGVAGLAAGEAELGPVPDDLVAACARHRLPLFAVSEEVAFATITEHVVRQVSGERAGDLAAVVDRHRRLMASGPAGGGPDAVLDLLGSDLDLRAWVLSPTGRRIAGTPEALPPARAAALAGEHLAAVRTGRPGPYRTVVEGTAYALFRATDARRAAAAAPGAATAPPPHDAHRPHERHGPHDARDTRRTALSDWLLAVEADTSDWPAARLDLLQGVTQLIAVERDRRDAARTVRRRLAQEVLELVQAGAPAAEIAARLRVAAPVLLPGLPTAPRWQVVVARAEWAPPGDEAEPAAGTSGTGPGDSPTTATGGTSASGGGPSSAHGEVARALLEEILVDPAAVGTDGADRIAVARSGDEAIALVPLPPPGSGRPLPGESRTETGTAPETGAAGTASGTGLGADTDAALHADTLLAAVAGPLSSGLGDDGRLTLGVSAAVHSAEGLRGALEEARHARRVAAARPGPVCAAGHHELASHVLLLPFVPDDVRLAFTARLLDPLRDYDRRHRAELIPTLEAFLDCDGSWTRCAARLHLHVNTLRYRVGRIEQLTGRELSRLEDKLDFFLALRMR
ncbi:PucR family transcriptional regulator [Streptomyces sp. NRRL F-5135]|uniref:PucR family transcriptional regulator n=1 Tax=Streptomyces sp. NRRL F-5135 TaxID=1463858 RepID=UPI0004C57876|nr:PucR family transcriptional regulator ligand-binding domain-containing protein [Streptomyces sp. NRRL F-5135]